MSARSLVQFSKPSFVVCIMLTAKPGELFKVQGTKTSSLGKVLYTHFSIISIKLLQRIAVSQQHCGFNVIESLMQSSFFTPSTQCKFITWESHSADVVYVVVSSPLEAFCVYCVVTWADIQLPTDWIVTDKLVWDTDNADTASCLYRWDSDCDPFSRIQWQQSVQHHRSQSRPNPAAIWQRGCISVYVSFALQQVKWEIACQNNDRPVRCLMTGSFIINS